MMSHRSRQELLDTVRARYAQAERRDKTAILDELVANTGYNRKYAITVLRHPREASVTRKRRGKRRYTLQVQAALITVWRSSNCICGKRLVPCMEMFVGALERHGELALDADTRRLLLRISPATADRLLHRERQNKGRGLGTTKPGTLLKKSIPIRTFADWDDKRPGFFEADLVAHCGHSTAGDFVHTLMLVDVATGWTDFEAVAHKSQKAVTAAIDRIRRRLPYPMLGLDSDNGAEFINGTLARYCALHHITFTRSRPYKKNDQPYVEQKNWSVVRQMVGYDRYEGPRAARQMQTLYDHLRPYVNYFQPLMKMTTKRRIGSRLYKQYDTARTPYHRVLDVPEASANSKAQLQQQHLSINPAAQLRHIHQLQEQLWRFAKG
jgi:Integrase core domain